MLYGEYRFQSVFEGDALLPSFKGSTFRGVFGTALKRVVCALKREDCSECILREQCVYCRVFEAPADGDRGEPAQFHPFVIEPPLSEETVFRLDDRFDFTLILFGWANDYLPYFVYAFREMGRLGVGRHVRGERGRFRLLRVLSGGQPVYSAEDDLLRPADAADLSLDPAPLQADRETVVRVVLQTPLRLKFDNRLTAELPFHVLVRAMLRRISALNRNFADGEPELDYRGLVARAQEVRVVDSSIGWFDWRRYSNRQEQGMLMGGMAGEVVYRGRLGEFMPLLKYSGKVHIGKATTFGLGKVWVGEISRRLSPRIGGNNG
jgi:hypothetical protein